MKLDEKILMQTLQQRAKETQQPYVREIIRELGMNEKRAAYICLKWANKGWYDYGVSCLSGWLTTEAPVLLSEETSC
jgi:hypothetical protein